MRSTSPLLSLEAFEDAVYDAKWHPLSPATLATADGDGALKLWHLTKDTEAPVVTVQNPGRAAVKNFCPSKFLEFSSKSLIFIDDSLYTE